MSNSIDANRSSSIVEAEQTINVLSTELVKFREIAKQWKIDFDVEVQYSETEKAYVVAVTGKTGYRGQTITISNRDAEYYSASPDDLARTVGQQLLQILWEKVDSELTPQISKAINNVNQINKSSM